MEGRRKPGDEGVAQTEDWPQDQAKVVKVCEELRIATPRRIDATAGKDCKCLCHNIGDNSRNFQSTQEVGLSVVGS